MIKAEDLGAPDDDLYPEMALLYSEDHEGLLLRLFGCLPDYADPRFDKIWNETNQQPYADVVAYCRSRGVDVMKSNGRPVPCYLDIAAVLRAVEAGVMTVNLPGSGRLQ